MEKWKKILIAIAITVCIVIVLFYAWLAMTR